jgi:hypothetical protein
MRVASLPAPEPRAVDCETLHWVAGNVCFELGSGEPAVLDLARVVFGPWLNGSAGGPAPRARFFVEGDASVVGGRWHVALEGSETTTVDTLELALATVEYRSIVELLNPETGVVALHAALLSKNGRGVLLVGPKEAGKSTLACALWRAGWRFHSDDSAVLEDGHRARGVPRRVSLRPTSRELLGAELWDRIASLPATTRTGAGGLLFHPGEAIPGDVPASVEVGAVIFLARLGSMAGAGEIALLDPARALLALWPYCHRRQAGIGEALRSIQPLADRVPMFDLGRGDLGVMVERVEEVLGR